jgi:hypothetical protein
MAAGTGIRTDRNPLSLFVPKRALPFHRLQPRPTATTRSPETATYTPAVQVHQVPEILGDPPIVFHCHCKASAPPTSSEISFVMAAWRILLAVKVSPDQLLGVLRRVLHGGHPGAHFRSVRFQERPKHLRFQVARKQTLPKAGPRRFVNKGRGDAVFRRSIRRRQAAGAWSVTTFC